MPWPIMEWVNGDFCVSDDRERLDIEKIVAWLQQTYWAQDRSRAELLAAFQNSFCIGLYHGEQQIGFARAVTDYATFTWICDVIVDEEYRGRGLGKWLVQCLIEHPRLQTRSQLLGTRDAHTLYERFGFQRLEMLKRVPGQKTLGSHKPDIL